MAIYHLSLKSVARASGRSAVAAAAYRAGDCLVNERDGMTHDFTRRGGVEHSEIILPTDSTAEWARSRTALWNAAEAAENRKDARTAKEFEIALPHELSKAQSLELTRDFATHLADRYGAAVDVAIHTPHEGKGSFQGKDIRNQHAHLLMTVRAVSENGFGEKIELEWQNKRLKDAGLSTTDQQLTEIRKEWEQFANQALARAGHDITIDHRSHKDRGLEIDPTQHVGVHATAVERKGKPVDRKRLDPEIAKQNAAVIIEKPDQLISTVIGEKSVFTKQDIARALHRYIDNPQDYQNALAKVMASPSLVELQAEQLDEQRRVVSEARYSTAEMIKTERNMALSADRMAEQHRFLVRQRWIDDAIETKEKRGGFKLEDEQREAIRHVTGGERIAAVVGKAGTGKSTLLDAARDAWEREGYHVHGAALAGKAAKGLEQSAGIKSRTLKSWEFAWSKGRDQLGPNDVFVIDEAGMVGSKQLGRILTAADRAGAKVVLVGDHEQLQAIEAGGAFRAVAERIGFASLEEVRRQREEWQREASKEFGRAATEKGLAAYAERGAIQFADTRETARDAVLRDVLADMDARPDGTRLVMAFKREDVRDLNVAIRTAREERGELSGAQSYYTNEGKRTFSVGDRVLFLKNDKKLDVKNGMLGVVRETSKGRLVVQLDTDKAPGNGRAVTVKQAEYAAIDHGYATTIHKSQGATVDRAYVLASNSMNRHLTYVAMTRHRDGVTMYAGQDEFKDMGALSKTLSRDGLKETTLDYVQTVFGYAERRGLNGERAIARLVERGQHLLDALGKRLDRAMERTRDRLGLPHPAVAPKEQEGRLVPRSAAPATTSRESGQKDAGERVYLTVPYSQKDQAKAVGARFDNERKQWYAPAGTDREAVRRWLPEQALRGTERAAAVPVMSAKEIAKDALRRELRGMTGPALGRLADSDELSLSDAAKRVSEAYAVAAERAETAKKAFDGNAGSIAHYTKFHDHHATAGLKRWNEMGIVKQLKHRAGALDKALALNEHMEKAMAEQLAPYEKAAPGLAKDLEDAEKDKADELENVRSAAETEQENHKERVAMAKEMRLENVQRQQQEWARERTKDKEQDKSQGAER